LLVEVVVLLSAAQGRPADLREVLASAAAEQEREVLAVVLVPILAGWGR